MVRTVQEVPRDGALGPGSAPGCVLSAADIRSFLKSKQRQWVAIPTLENRLHVV